MPPDHITILGGGPAGLAAGYFAAKRALPFTIFEAMGRYGGNAVTLQHGDFRFDTGAHRFHDKDPEMTMEVQALLGPELLKINLPSNIFYQGKLLDFPLSAVSLMRSLSLPFLVRAGWDLLRERLRPEPDRANFESATVHKYGRTISQPFLLDYSEKLWGLPSQQLSVQISGSRLKGLTPSMLLREIVLGASAKPAHMEGDFYYPRMGYGAIMDRLADVCGRENIRLGSPVSGIHHNDTRISAISTASGERLPVTTMINTIPITSFFRALDPRAPQQYVDIARSLRFRNLVLVVLFLDAAQVTTSATAYFPETRFPFTRLYEPINRSRMMAPEGKTSLCVEIPCYAADDVWKSEDAALVDMTSSHLESIGWVDRSKLIGSQVLRLSHAYPVLEAGFEAKIQMLLDYLARFSNLKVIGRNGRFVYKHVHDMLRFGHDVIEELEQPAPTTAALS